jgi:DNA-binding transcriptional LysR family regulator
MAISHRIRALETEMGCLLFVRKTRAIELTTAGQSLYSAVREGFDTIAAGVDRLRQRASHGENFNDAGVRGEMAGAAPRRFSRFASAH